MTTYHRNFHPPFKPNHPDQKSIPSFPNSVLTDWSSISAFSSCAGLKRLLVEDTGWENTMTRRNMRTKQMDFACPLASHIPMKPGWTRSGFQEISKSKFSFVISFCLNSSPPSPPREPQIYKSFLAVVLAFKLFLCVAASVLSLLLLALSSLLYG